MYMARVIGNVVATRKEDSLVGLKFMVIKRVNAQEQEQGMDEVAADYVGAGIGDYVLVGQGSSVRVRDDKKSVPVDLAIIGIIDSIDVEGLVR